MAVSKKVIARITQQLKRYRSTLEDAKSRDIGEADTVDIIRDMLSDVLGYKKLSEITAEFAIRGTYVDLAVKVGQELRFLLEAKAIGVSLKDKHVKQAVDYAANQGVEWVILSNACTWRIYKVIFGKPIEKSLLCDVDLLASNLRDPKLLDCFYNLSREGFARSVMRAFFHQQQATSKFSLAALLLTDRALNFMRRELRRLFPDVKVETSALKAVLENDVIKRDVLESEEAHQAVAVLKQAARKAGDKSKPKVQAPATVSGDLVTADASKAGLKAEHGPVT
ncbi:MAG: restriction endonuclease subunit R [Alphaproteobacteria bacterium]